MIFGLFNSCNDDDGEDECISTGIGYVTSVNSPSSGLVNETVNIELDFIVINGCGEFGQFIESQNNNIRNITVEAKYEGCLCTQDIPTRKINYLFSTESAGDYELKFKSSPTEFITVNLSIN
jgi:hypothetical protein